MIAAFCSVPLLAQFTGANVTPSGSSSAMLTGTANGKSTGGNGHAFLHDSNLNQDTDLNPIGATSSVAKGTDGTVEVGYSHMSTNDACTVWSDNAASAVTLTPSTYSDSYCFGTDGGEHVGWVYRVNYITVNQDAALWFGTSSSITSLSPGSGYSRARAIHGGEQVGEIDQYTALAPEDTTPSVSSQAVLWHGTAASMVRLYPPPGFSSSAALATNANALKLSNQISN